MSRSCPWPIRSDPSSGSKPVCAGPPSYRPRLRRPLHRLLLLHAQHVHHCSLTVIAFVVSMLPTTTSSLSTVAVISTLQLSGSSAWTRSTCSSGWWWWWSCWSRESRVCAAFSRWQLLRLDRVFLCVREQLHHSACENKRMIIETPRVSFACRHSGIESL